MKLVKIIIISGVFGYLNNGVIEKKTSKDTAFEVDEKTAQRLVNAKVAAYAEEKVQSSELSPLTSVDYTPNTRFNDLIAIAKAKGIEVPTSAKSKQAVYNLIKAFDVAQQNEDGQDHKPDEESPDLGDDSGAVVENA